MHVLRVDDEVFAALEKRARPFVDTPNSTLRRILRLDPRKPMDVRGTTAHRGVEMEALLDEATFGARGARRRAAKVDLEVLVRRRTLRDGDRLWLVDFRGERVGRHEAVLDSGRLRFGGKLHSMSSLARRLLAGAGITRGNVRGPAHWADAKGRTVLQLWHRVRPQSPGLTDRSA